MSDSGLDLSVETAFAGRWLFIFHDFFQPSQSHDIEKSRNSAFSRYLQGTRMEPNSKPEGKFRGRGTFVMLKRRRSSGGPDVRPRYAYVSFQDALSQKGWIGDVSITGRC
jgi:hypothetical protein